jgi:hypothetical protein
MRYDSEILLLEIQIILLTYLVVKIYKHISNGKK